MQAVVRYAQFYSLYFLYDANSDSKVLLMRSAMFEIVHCGLLSVQRSKAFDRRGLRLTERFWLAVVNRRDYYATPSSTQ